MILKIMTMMIITLMMMIIIMIMIMTMTLMQMVGCSTAPSTCRCVPLTESSQCPLCGRSVRGLRTRQRSLVDHSDRQDDSQYPRLQS